MTDEQKAAARYNCLVLACNIPQDPKKIVELAQEFYDFTTTGFETKPSTADDIPF